MKFFHADMYHEGPGVWLAHIHELDIQVLGTTKANAEYNAYNLIQEAEGWKSFALTWGDL